MLSCFDAKTGQAYYHQVRLPKPDNYKASLIGANGKLYIASESGDVTIVKMGEKFEIMKVNTIEDEFFIATPVVAQGQLFLRGRNHLYCIGEK
jgi:outer membrane protein assembly factor BamB